MNIVVFNYRGYGASTGSPDPTKLQSDGLVVAKYLKDHLGFVNLMIHGESLGGMVASNIARHINLKGIFTFKIYIHRINLFNFNLIIIFNILYL